MSLNEGHVLGSRTVLQDRMFLYVLAIGRLQNFMMRLCSSKQIGDMTKKN